MYKKLVGLVVFGLLIITAISAVGITNIKIVDISPLPLQNGAIDQEQTTHCNIGMQIRPPLFMAQSFKPTIEDLTAVQLWLFKAGTPPDGVEITVSIRNDLNGSDLTSRTINTDEVEITPYGTWVYFNFDDITIIPEETYYIVCSGSDGNDQYTYCWLFDIGDKYTRGEAWHSSDYGVTWITLWEWFEYSPEWEEPDFCFKTYFKDSAICCNGSLSWEKVPPGGTVSGTFEISNCGDYGTLLNWKFESVPNWPGAIFEIEPDSGQGLQEGESVTITVNVTAPTNESKEFTGTIKMINSDDPTDFCEIDMYLKTPRSRTIYNTLFLKLFERFPNAFPILRQLLGL